VGEHDAQRVPYLAGRLSRGAQVKEVALEPALVGGVALKLVSRGRQERADRPLVRSLPARRKLQVLHGSQAAGKAPIREPPAARVAEAQLRGIEPELVEGRLGLTREGRDDAAQNARENHPSGVHGPASIAAYVAPRTMSSHPAPMMTPPMICATRSPAL